MEQQRLNNELTKLDENINLLIKTQEELDSYLTRIEEAKLRDHRTIGKAMDLYSIQDEIGSGLVVWTPEGAFMRHVIENLWKEIHFQTHIQK